jgi:hypothetical protein
MTPEVERRLCELRTLRSRVRLRLYLWGLDARLALSEIDPQIERLVQEIASITIEHALDRIAALTRSIRDIEVLVPARPRLRA